jgi:hypothetical protein
MNKHATGFHEVSAPMQTKAEDLFVDQQSDQGIEEVRTLLLVAS